MVIPAAGAKASAALNLLQTKQAALCAACFLATTRTPRRLGLLNLFDLDCTQADYSGRLVNDMMVVFSVTDPNHIHIDGGLLNQFVQAVHDARHNFPHQEGGLTGASPFKRAGWWFALFVKFSPIMAAPIDSRYSETVSRYLVWPNSLFGFVMVRRFLTHSQVSNPRRPNELLHLAKPLNPSWHSYREMLEAMGSFFDMQLDLASQFPLLSDQCIASHYKFISLMLEQFCYAENPEAAYPSVSEKMAGF